MLWAIVILLGLVVVLLWQIWSVLDKAYVAQLKIEQFLEQYIVPRTAEKPAGMKEMGVES